MPAVQDDIAAIPVSVSTLVPEAVVGLSLYLPRDRDRPWQLYRAPDCALTEQDIEALTSRGITRLYLARDEQAVYQQHLRTKLDRMLADESIAVSRRFSTLNLVVRDVLSDMFRTGTVANQIHELEALGEKTVQLVCRDDVAVHELRSVLMHDYHTFTHSANVAFYCVMLAKALGISDTKELNQVALGGLLHDAGKLDIPAGLLTKPERLTDEEFAIVRRHAELGFRKLAVHGELSFAQLMMAYQHHEHLDGGGYPVRSVSREIHDWAKICAVADVFEALTSNRPYRAALPVERACSIMHRKAGAQFDKSVLACWTQLITNG